MSGKKDIQVRMTREQRDRLITTTRQALETAQQLQQREELRQSAQQLANSSISLITNLLQQQVNGLHDDLRAMAAEQNHRLTRMANDYARNIEELRKQRIARMCTPLMEAHAETLKGSEDRTSTE